MHRGRWFEELVVGDVIDHTLRRTVTETDNLLFSTLTLNFQPLHLDAEFARGTEFGERLMNSMFTLGLVVGISVPELTYGTVVANLGFEHVSFPAPVVHGDTIRVRSTVTELRDSRSRPGAGIATFEHLGLNQVDAIVVRCVRTALMHRRPRGES